LRWKASAFKIRGVQEGSESMLRGQHTGMEKEGNTSTAGGETLPLRGIFLFTLGLKKRLKKSVHLFAEGGGVGGEKKGGRRNGYKFRDFSSYE